MLPKRLYQSTAHVECLTTTKSMSSVMDAGNGFIPPVPTYLQWWSTQRGSGGALHAVKTGRSD